MKEGIIPRDANEQALSQDRLPGPRTPDAKARIGPRASWLTNSNGNRWSPRFLHATWGVFYKEADLKPHRLRYWLNTDLDPEQFANEARLICPLYRNAPTLYAAGVYLCCTDEKSGIQALEHKYPLKPMRPGLIDRIEFEYVRHGTQCLIANFLVATGEVIAPTVGDTRTEADFLAHIQQTVATAPDAGWIFITDRLDIHLSASLVEWIATTLGDPQPLGKKYHHGILKSRQTRMAYLTDKTHRIRFAYVPKHASWLNQVEIWFSILVRRLLKRGSFTSVYDLRERILRFIDYFNRALAKPFKWTYMEQGQVRRLPVVDAAGRVEGIIALADLVQHVKNEREVTEVLERVSSPTNIPRAA